MTTRPDENAGQWIASTDHPIPPSPLTFAALLDLRETMPVSSGRLDVTGGYMLIDVPPSFSFPTPTEPTP